MANEFKHTDVGGGLTEAEYDSVTGHQFDSQATGDIMYATSSSQLSRLGVGATGAVLTVTGGIPAWDTTWTPTGHVIPGTDAAYDLGSSTLGFNDLHLGSGGVVNLDGGDVTLTHSAGTLTYGGDGAVSVVFGADVDLQFTGGTGTNEIVLANGLADALSITDGSADVISISTADGTNTVAITGDLTVSGTQTVVDTVTMNAANAVVFEGATADAYETTLTIEDPTADRTVVIPDVGGTLAVLAADSDTAITATPAELNLIDGGTARGSDAIGDGDGVLINDDGTMKMTTVQTLAAYLDDEITAMPNLATVGTIGTGVWEATDVAVAHGGTGASSATAGFDALSPMTAEGDVLYGGASGTVTKLAKGSDADVLTLASGVPSWAAPTTGDITGVTAGTGLSGGGSSGGVTLNVDAAQGHVTSLGTQAADFKVGNGYGLIVGHTAQVTAAGVPAEFQVLGSNDAEDGAMILGNFEANSGGPLAIFLKSRNAGPYAGGTGGSIVADGDNILQIIGAVDDGADFATRAGALKLLVDDGSPAENAVGGKWAFFTNTTAGAEAERLGIDSAGLVTIANTGGLVVGHSAAIPNIEYATPALQVVGSSATGSDDGSDNTFLVSKFGGAGGPLIALAHTGHTTKGNLTTALSDNDQVGTIGWFGGDGVDLFTRVAEIDVLVDGAVAENQVPTEMLFKTSTTGGARTTALTLTPAQDVLIPNGMMLIGDTANGNMTQGLTIHQGSAAAKEIFAIKTTWTSGDHPYTDFMEGDTHFMMEPINLERGGMFMYATAQGAGGSVGTIGLSIETIAGGVDTGKTTSSSGGFRVNASQEDGTGRKAYTADGNLMNIATGGTTRFLFDTEGSAHADVEWTTWADDYNDIELIRSIKDYASPTAERFYDLELLEEMKIIGKDSLHYENGKARVMLNQTGLLKLHHAAFVQIWDSLQEQIGTLEKRLLAAGA